MLCSTRRKFFAAAALVAPLMLGPVLPAQAEPFASISNLGDTTVSVIGECQASCRLRFMLPY